MPTPKFLVPGQKQPLLAALVLMVPLAVGSACSGEPTPDPTATPDQPTETATATAEPTATQAQGTDTPDAPTDEPTATAASTPTASAAVTATPEITATPGDETQIEPTDPQETTAPTPTADAPTVDEPTEQQPTEQEPTEPGPTDPPPTPDEPTEPGPTEPGPTDPPPTPDEPTDPPPTPDQPTDPSPTDPNGTPTPDDPTVDETPTEDPTVEPTEDPTQIGPTPTAGETPTLGDDSLYTRLGEEEGITDLITDFVGRVVADPAINGYFLNSSVNAERLERCLVKQVGNLSGGPQVYPDPIGTGDGCRNMADSHAGLGISTADYNDLSSHFVDALSAAEVSESDIAIFGAIFDDENFKSDIIEDGENDQTIYQRMGRKPEIESVVTSAIGTIVADSEINAFFGEANAERLGTCLVRQLCSIDGPCIYGQGVEEALDGNPCADMQASHDGLTNSDTGSGITLQDFNAILGHFDVALTSSNTSGEDKQSIIATLDGMCRDIVADEDECGGAIPDETPPPPPDALVISQYIEGDGNNKALELSNSTGNEVDLSEYALRLISNGGTFDDASELALSGTLANDDAYVIANPQSDSEILAVADYVESTALITNFNGNDAIGLYKNGVLIDVIGETGDEPGVGWDVAGVTQATHNHSLIRKLEVFKGTINWAESAGTNADDSQWIVLDKDDFTNLGDHPYFP